MKRGAAISSNSISLIKWTGNKRRQADQIVSRFPGEVAAYHEPFLGGGAVLGRLLDSPVRVGRFECSDAFAPLIALWNLVKDDPDRLVSGYARMWSAARADGEAHYHEVRRSFNRSRCPIEFFFLLRTCRLGHVRITSQNDFVSAYDRRQAGVHPDRLHPVVHVWHRKLVAAEVRFAVRDYREVSSGPGDLLYLDPPYPTASRYYGRIDYAEFFRWLGSQRGGSLLSLGGHVGAGRTQEVPPDLYDEHVQFEAGDNPFHRLGGRPRTPLSENLYIRSREDWIPQLGFPVGADVGRDDPLGQHRLTPEDQASGDRTPRPHAEGMSAAIRSLLDDDPWIKPVQVKRRLAQRGMAVSSTLFRVVRLDWRRRRGRG